MSRFFSEDHIYRDLTIALSLLLVLSPVFDYLFKSSRIDSYLTTGFLLFALYEISRRTSDLVIGLALGVPAVAGGVFNAATPDTPTMNVTPTILAALFLGFLIYRVLKDVFVGKRISSEKIFGAVCAYLLIGFLFSSIYGFIALVDSNAFAVTDALAAEMVKKSEVRGTGFFAYFSFVTMSTLGYGDIAPVSTAARSFAWIQAVLGQLYLAISVGALVGFHIAKNRD